MEGLQLNLFGKPEIILNGAPVTGFESAKVPALLYYLAVTGQAHSRDTLATLLWGDLPEATAKRNLTKALTNLRQLLDPYLLIERHSVVFNHQLPAAIDAVVFQAAVEGSTLLEPDNPERDLAPLRQAVSLYRGDFLEGFYVKNALEFEEWALGQREYLRELMLQALQRLTEQSARLEDNPVAALEYCRRWLGLEPWQEAAHRQMMLLLARSGQRDAALAQYEICRQVLAEELSVEPMAETTALFERLKASGAPLPHNLPAAPSPFVGRTAELQYIARQLADPACRLFTLVGPGGIGKTRLALEVAKSLTRPEATLDGVTFIDGICLVNLTSVTPSTAGEAGPDGYAANGLAATLLDALTLFFHSSADVMTHPLDILRPKTMLLILDNFEHLTAEAKLLSEVLNQAPGVKLLVTSRTRLNLLGEWVLELGGLEFPTEVTAAVDPAGIQQAYSAVTLFMQRAQQAHAQVTCTKEEIAWVIRICQLVEGVPLALELAASWLPVLPCAGIAAEIEKSLDFLDTSVGNLPQRHRSLRAVFEQSWQMLSPREQDAFAKSSIYHGGFELEAAKHITGISLPTLANLVTKSLLRLTSSGRYEMHELLRQYAAEKLWLVQDRAEATSGTPSHEAAKHLWSRYSAYYLHRISQQEAELWGRQPHRIAAQLRPELDNIRQAWRWAVNNLDLAAIDRSISGLARFCDVTNLFQEGETCFRQAAIQVQTTALAREMVLDQSTAQSVLIKLLSAQAMILTRRGLAAQAVEVARNAVTLAEERQDPALEAVARRQLGDALQFQGIYEPAVVELERALKLARSIPLPWVEAEALRDLAITGHYQNNNTTAEVYARQALICFQALGDRRNEGLLFLVLGGICAGQEDYLHSKENFERSRLIFEEINDRWLTSLAYGGLGWACYELGEYTPSLAYFERALHICRERQDYITEVHTVRDLANLRRDLGDYAQARRDYEYCFELRQKSGNLHNEGYALAGLGLLLHYQGDHQAARDYCLQAREFAQQVGIKAAEGLALLHLGHALVALNQPTEAVAAYQAAVDLLHTVGMPRRAAMAMAGLAEIALSQGQLGQAQDYFNSMLPYLDADRSSGINEIFRVYLICYRILRAAHDPRAGEILATANHLLRERAANIQDERLRHSFLENITAHRELLKEYEQSGQAGRYRP
ncbi:MAG: tetratricopeptide repeat protein [Anaerolineales bacterium]|nr:tetratricopeptide repeat protein [Anaerolineales bacterium]